MERLFKPGCCTRHGLHVSRNLLVAAQHRRPALHVWEWGTPSSAAAQKIVLPEAPSCLAVSPDDQYCVVGTASGKVHLWQVASGRFLASLPAAHFRAVSVLRFSSDGSHFLSAGDDSIVHVWCLQTVLTQAVPDAVHTWTEHSLPITDLAVGCGGAWARVATASKDRTVKLWELCPGTLLHTIAFPSEVN